LDKIDIELYIRKRVQNDDVDLVFGKMYKILAVFIASRIDIRPDTGLYKSDACFNS
jgi:hypothetical protein